MHKSSLIKMINFFVGGNVVFHTVFHNFPFSPATYHQKLETTPCARGVTRFANIPSAYSCNKLFTKKITLEDDFGMLHIIAICCRCHYVIFNGYMCAAMSSLLPWTSNRSSAKFGQRSKFSHYSLPPVYVPRIAKHAHYPLESSWEMGHRVAHKWTAFCPDLSLPGAACDSVCVCACVWWKGKGGNLHVCCVCMYRTLCSQLKGACMYIELQQQPQCLIFLHKIVVSDFVLSSHSQTQLLNPPGKSLSTRVVILSFLVQTLSHSICER